MLQSFQVRLLIWVTGIETLIQANGRDTPFGRDRKRKASNFEVPTVGEEEDGNSTDFPGNVTDGLVFPLTQFKPNLEHFVLS